MDNKEANTIRLDLGGGYAPAPEHINIDLIPQADIVWDLNLGLPLFEKYSSIANIRNGKWLDDEEGKIEGIRCNQVIEHLDTIIPLMNDCYTVLKPGSLLEISTPKGGTDPWWQDPTHKKGYVLESFLYFCKNATAGDFKFDSCPFANEQKEYGITARFTLEWYLLEHHWNLQVKLRK